jgi:hypothetical protein
MARQPGAIAITSYKPVLGELQALPRKSALLRVPDLQDDLAGLVGCARKHGLRLARLRKRQE